jgi:hypothetical protein
MPLLILLLSVAAGNTPAALIPPFYLDCVVAVGYEPLKVEKGPDGKLVASRDAFRPMASGFLYGRYREPGKDGNGLYGVYLVTNHHVWEGIERVETEQIARVSKLVDLHETPKMILQFNPRTPGAPAQQFAISLHNSDIVDNPNGRWDWAQDEDADLAVKLFRVEGLDAAGIQYNFFRSDRNAAGKRKALEAGITEGDDIYVLGFPMGLVGGARNFVIARRGSIARIKDSLAGAVSPDRFLIDALVYPGNSGGPVVTRPSVDAVQGTKAQDQAYLIGVVSAYIPYEDTAVSQQTGRVRIAFEENSGLAEIIPIDAVDKLVIEREKIVWGK